MSPTYPESLSINKGRYSGDAATALVDGAVAQPSIAFADDSDTGIYSPADGQVCLTVDGEDAVKCMAGGAVELNHNNVKKLATASNGITITDGHITFDTDDCNIYIKDGGKAKFGTGEDLIIYHDGSNSYVSDTSTGNLKITSDGTAVSIEKSDGENMAIFRTDGSVDLYYDNVKKFETTSTGCNSTGGWQSPDGQAYRAGTGNDLLIYHDGSDSYMENGTGDLYLRNKSGNDDKDIVIQARSGEHSIVCRDDAAVDLYHDGTKKFETSANGIIVSGSISLAGPVSPSTDDTWDIGDASYRWDDIRATNGSIVTSDRNEKESITATDLGLAFVNKLTPVSFKRKGKTRTHYGLVAQDVETVITDLGKTTTQFAPLIKDTLDDGTERYGLRYVELIAPLIKAVQELSAKVEALEAG